MKRRSWRSVTWWAPLLASVGCLQSVPLSPGGDDDDDDSVSIPQVTLDAPLPGDRAVTLSWTLPVEAIDGVRIRRSDNSVLLEEAGTTATDYFTSNSVSEDYRVQSYRDGVAGRTYSPSQLITGSTLERGDLDPDFGDAGIYVFGDQDGQTEIGYDLYVDSTDAVYISGRAYNGSETHAAVWKLTNLGALDMSFSTGGFRSLSSIANDNIGAGYAIGGGSTGIALAGTAVFTGESFYVWSLPLNGSTSSAAPNDGTFSNGDDGGADVVMRDDGSFISVGWLVNDDGGSPDEDLDLVAYDSSFTRDTAWDLDFNISGTDTRGVAIVEDPTNGDIYFTSVNDQVTLNIHHHSAGAVQSRPPEAFAIAAGTSPARGTHAANRVFFAGTDSMSRVVVWCRNTLNNDACTPLLYSHASLPAVGNDAAYDGDHLMIGGAVGAEGAVIRLSVDGIVDTEFGTEGVAFLGGNIVHGIAVDNMGRIVAVGELGDGMAAWRIVP